MNLKLYHVTNNFNCICEDCLDDFDFDTLYQPAFVNQNLSKCIKFKISNN